MAKLWSIDTKIVSQAKVIRSLDMAYHSALDLAIEQQVFTTG